jgi:antitoxin PrlF
MNTVKITSLSSKGQIVIPQSIRTALNISAGAKFAVISDGENILLRPVEKPDIEAFRKLVAESRKFAREAGLKKSDITAAIKKARRENRS